MDYNQFKKSVPESLLAAVDEAMRGSQTSPKTPSGDEKPPFDKPFAKAGPRKDRYGNPVKNVARHLARKGLAMHRVAEESEPIDEISKASADEYSKAAMGSLQYATIKRGDDRWFDREGHKLRNSDGSVKFTKRKDSDMKSDDKTIQKRLSGLQKAQKILTKEAYITEGSVGYKHYTITGGQPHDLRNEVGAPEHVAADLRKLKNLGVHANEGDGEKYGHVTKVTVTNNQTGEKSHHHVYQRDMSRNQQRPVFSVRHLSKPHPEHINVLKHYIAGKTKIKDSLGLYETSSLQEADVKKHYVMTSGREHRVVVAGDGPGGSSNPKTVKAFPYGDTQSKLTSPMQHAAAHAFAKKMNAGIKKDVRVPNYRSIAVEEDVEQIDELSKATLGSYVKKAANSMATNYGDAKTLKPWMERQRMLSIQHQASRTVNKRDKGIERATSKLTKEDSEETMHEAYPTAASLARKSKAIKQARAVATGYANQKSGKWASQSYKTDDGRWASKDVKEEAEGLDELTKKILQSYIAKAGKDRTKQLGNERKYENRMKGSSQAVAKLAKANEEAEIQEKVDPVEAREFLNQHKARDASYFSMRDEYSTALLNHAKKSGYKPSRGSGKSIPRAYHDHLNTLADRADAMKKSVMSVKEETGVCESFEPGTRVYNTVNKQRGVVLRPNRDLKNRSLVAVKYDNGNMLAHKAHFLVKEDSDLQELSKGLLTRYELKNERDRERLASGLWYRDGVEATEKQKKDSAKLDKRLASNLLAAKKMSPTVFDPKVTGRPGAKVHATEEVGQLEESVAKVRKALEAGKLFSDSIGKNKDGHVVVRNGFYYKSGRSAEAQTAKIKRALDDAGVKHTIVKDGEHNAPFRGGASVGRQSHFYTHIKLHEDMESIDELSAQTKDSYVKKAVKQLPGLFDQSGKTAEGARKYYNRKNTVRKIANEDVEEIAELRAATIDSYRKKAYDQQPAGDDGSQLYKKRKTGRDLAFKKVTHGAKIMATEEEVKRGRGRPSKASLDIEDEPEALGMQLRKAKSINKPVTFNNKETKQIDPKHLFAFNNHMDARRTTQEKHAFQKKASASHADFVKAVSEPVPARAKDTGEIIRYGQGRY